MTNLSLSRRRMLAAAGIAPLTGALSSNIFTRTAQAAEEATPAAAKSDAIKIVPFKINVPQPQIDDILARVKNVRWPVAPVSRNPDEYGAGLEMMKALQKYWVTEYNWREQEAKLNAFPQFKATVDGRDIHFIHVKGSGKNPQPIMLIHGWPGSFIEFTRCIEQLTQPEKFGGSEDDAFTVVVPSLPGFAFSSKPPRPIGTTYIGRVFDRLMVEGLGYKNYIAQGGDFGSIISLSMAAESDQCKAALVNFLIGVGQPPQNEEEKAAQAQWDKVYIKEGAYQHIQRTKPLSLAYGMADSPMGTAAWLMEKYKTWAGVPGDNPWSIYPKSQVLTIIMVYIITNSFGSSTWMYATQDAHGGGENPEETLQPRRPAQKHKLGVIHFPTELVFWPKSFAERNFDLVYWSDVAAGGHFAAFEQPLLFAREVRDFNQELKKRG